MSCFLRGGVRVGVALAAAFVMAIACTTHEALAHGDEGLLRGSVQLAPGEVATWEGDVHYHRVITRIDAEGPVEVRLLERDSGRVVLERPPATLVTMNTLVRCCDERGWTPHVLELENAGLSEVGVSASARLVHDDFAVMVYGAEPGAHASIFVLGAIWTLVIYRTAWRRRSISSLRRAGATSAVWGVIAGLLLLAGELRHGVGGPPAVLASSSELPLLPYNPYVSGTSLVVLLLMAGWALGAKRWAAAVDDSAQAGWYGVGAALVASVVVTACLMAREYGTAMVPVLAAVAAAGPLVAVLALRWRTPHQSRQAREIHGQRSKPLS